MIVNDRNHRIGTGMCRSDIQLFSRAATEADRVRDMGIEQQRLVLLGMVNSSVVSGGDVWSVLLYGELWVHAS